MTTKELSEAGVTRIVMPSAQDEINFAARTVLARLEEVYGREYWTEKPASTDLQEAAQRLAQLLPARHAEPSNS